MGLLVSNPADPCSCTVAGIASRSLTPSTQPNLGDSPVNSVTTWAIAATTNPDTAYRYNLSLVATPLTGDPTQTYCPVLTWRRNGTAWIFAQSVTITFEIDLNGSMIYSQSGDAQQMGTDTNVNQATWFILLPGWVSDGTNNVYNTDSVAMLVPSDGLTAKVSYVPIYAGDDTYKGAWNATTAYNVGDSVQDYPVAGAYKCLIANTGMRPQFNSNPNNPPTYWEQFWTEQDDNPQGPAFQTSFVAA